MKLVVLDANAFWTEQLYSACARFADVLLLKPRDFRAHHQIHGDWRSDAAPRKISERVWEQCFSMPPGWMFSLWPLAERAMAKHVRQFVGGDQFVLVITYPQYRSLVRRLRPALSIYYNLDDYSDNWPSRAKAIAEWEHETVSDTDLTICIAQRRQEELRKRVAEKAGFIFHLPLGCTPQFMSGASSRPEIPSVLQKISRPIAGYIGALNSRFDFEFLSEVAERSPAVSFVLGGKMPSREQGSASWWLGCERAGSLANVHFIGWVEHDELGEYLNAFDLLLMCYSDCRFNRNASPAKLWDYLGTGLPIVANDRNPETLLWREVIQIGENPEIFARRLREALTIESAALRERRLEIARAHTWEVLSRRWERIIEEVSLHADQA